MPANPWELRADVRPLEVAATRWTEIGALMSRRGDELVDGLRRKAVRTSGRSNAMRTTPAATARW